MNYKVHRVGLRVSVCLLALVAGCSTYVPSRPHYYSTRGAAPAGPHTTLASWYGPGFEGRRTSSGESYDSQRLTAASRTLPLGTYARVANLDNGQSVVVRVNDRGPFVRGRGIDLSQAAANQVGLAREGVARVRVTRMDSTASEVPLEPERWSGTVHVRRSHHVHHHYRHRRWRMERNPVASWLLEMTR
ncbi:MAG TPA: septal ring lytic transglycosylase RlpA family protein [Candidatus Binataceae bacterium]|nr:septal ring lytic transglycosylase RlpA family protein [Candidatus Binataceae bacterium]